MRRYTVLFAILIAGLLMTGCATTKIGRILDDPGRYRNRSVRVEGTVTKSAGLLGTGGYEVQDNTGKIYVISQTGVPRTGSRVSVNGSVLSGAEVMGRSFGTAIREHGHKVHY
jgi:hypothetical protein